MAKTATKQRAIEIGDWQQADQAMAELRAAQAALQGVEAEREKLVIEVERRFAKSLDELESQLVILNSELQKFAKAHKPEFKAAPSGDGRSYDHAGVVIGFRLTPPFVRIRDEETAVGYLKQFYGFQFIRIKHEADREALLKSLKEDEKLAERLGAHGITLDQKDKFFCEVKET